MFNGYPGDLRARNVPGPDDLASPPAIMSGLLPRAVLAFLALPGVVAFPSAAVPACTGRVRGLRPVARFRPARRSACGIALVRARVLRRRPGHAGSVVTPAGSSSLRPSAVCIGSHVIRCTVAVLLLLSGWALLFASWTLAAYAVAVMVAFHIRVVWYEEPWLAERHGSKWLRHKNQVPRWLGWRRSE